MKEGFIRANPKNQQQKKVNKTPTKTGPLQPPLTPQAKIQQQKLNYKLAQDKGDFLGKRIANTTANKIRKESNIPVYSSIKGDKQAALTEAKTPTGLRKVPQQKVEIALKQPAPTLSPNHPLNRARKTVSPLSASALNDMFDKKETYMDKAKKGNFKGAALNLLGTTMQAPQSLYLNTVNNVASITSGKGTRPFKYNMDYTDYENEVKKRTGDKTITEKLSRKNKTLGNLYNFTMNVATDPLNLLDGAAVQTAKGLKKLGSAKYAEQLSKSKLVPTKGIPVRKNTSEAGGRIEAGKPRLTQFKDKDSYVNEIVDELAARHNPRNLTTADLKVRDNNIAQELDKVANMSAPEFRTYARQNRITKGQLPQLHNKPSMLEQKIIADNRLQKQNVNKSVYTKKEEKQVLNMSDDPQLTSKAPVATSSFDGMLQQPQKYVNGLHNNQESFIPTRYKNGNGINNFTENDIVNLTSSKSVASKADDDFKNFIKDYSESKESKRFYFGKVSDELANDIKGATNSNVENYNIAIRNDELKHIIKNHGNPEKEALRGQIGIDNEILSKLPQVFNKPDRIVLSPNKDYAGRVAIEVEKRINGYAIVTTGVSDGKNTIFIDSMRVVNKKKPLHTSDVLKTSNQTPVTSMKPASSFNSILQQSQKNVNKLPDKLGKLYQNTVDSQYTIGKAIKGINQTADKNAKILASNARNARGTVEYSIKNGLVDMEGKQVAKVPLQTVFDSTSNVDAFNDYLLHKHNVDRFREDKPVFGRDVTSADSARIVKEYEQQFPQFKELSKSVNENNNKLVDEWLVKGGLISKDLGEKLKLKYKNYVPSYREGTVKTPYFNNKGLKANTVVKNAVGGDKPVIPPNVSIGLQMQQAIKAVKKNEIYQGLLDAVRKDPGRMSGYAKLADDSANTKYQNTILKNTFDDLDPDDIEKISNELLQIDNKTGKFYATAMENGKPIRMEVSEELFKTLKSLDEMNDGVLDNTARLFKRYATNPFKALITGYNPFFALRNVARDIPTSYIQGTENNPLKWGRNLIDAGIQMRKNSEAYKEFKALGGKQSGYFNAEKGITSENLPTRILRKAGEGITTFNEATETLPRFGEYLGTLKREGNNYAAKQKALYNAGEVTVNFNRNGKYVKAADSFIPYLNPAVQGIDKSIRTFSKPENVAKAIGIVSVPSAAVYALNHKNPEDAKNYEMLDNRTKDTYFVFPIGDGKYIKIPKSREAGVLFSALPERIYRGIQGDKEAFKGFGNTVTTNFAPQNPIEDNIFAPATLNLAKNKDFANRTIIPTAMVNDKRSKYLQYDETTSELSKWVGNAVRKLPGMEQGLSPKVIDYLIDSYTGIIGDLLLPATTKGQNPIENVLTKPFTADTVYNNELQNTFYEDFDKATRDKTDLNINKDIPSEWKTPEEKKVAAYNKISQQMSDIRKQINTRRAEGASKEELRSLREQLNALAVKGPAIAEKVYKEYKKTYIPEISGLSEQKQEGYRKYAKSVKPQVYNDAYVQSKQYKSDLGKAMSVLGNFKDGDSILKGFGISDKTVQKARTLSNQGITAQQFEDYKKNADINHDGNISAIEAHRILKNEPLTAAQKMHLIQNLKGTAPKKKK